MRLLFFVVLAACSDGPNEDTLVDELRVLAIQGEPPEAAPGDDVVVTSTIADPAGEGARVLSWTCTNLGDGCLEYYATTGSLEGDQFSATAILPEELAVIATDEALQTTLAWTLACEPGICPQIDDPDAWDLADPASWLADLPMEGVSLAAMPLSVSTREEPLENPALTADFDSPLAAAPEEGVELAFLVDLSVSPTADTLAFGYATGGGFEETEYAVGDDGEVTLTWFAPKEAGTVALYVVINDGAGGVGVWVGEASVE